jgi:integrase
METEMETEREVKVFERINGRKYTVRNNRDRYFFPDEWGKFFDNLKPKQKFTFSALINTGARINEIRNVKAEDCDFDRKRIILRVTKKKAARKEKSPRPRVIPISTQFAREAKKFVSDNNLQGSDTLRILSTSAANTAMKNALIKAGIKDYCMFSIHNIRKTLEVWLMSLGVDTLPLVAHMGHDVRTAAQNYVSPAIFDFKERDKMRMIIGDLYQDNYRR